MVHSCPFIRFFVLLNALPESAARLAGGPKRRSPGARGLGGEWLRVEDAVLGPNMFASVVVVFLGAIYCRFVESWLLKTEYLSLQCLPKPKSILQVAQPHA